MYLVERTKVDYIPSAGEHSVIEVRHKIIAVMSRYTLAEYASDAVQAGDVKITTETDLVPTREWELEYGLIRFKIISITEITSQDIVVAYTMQLRE